MAIIRKTRVPDVVKRITKLKSGDCKIMAFATDEDRPHDGIVICALNFHEYCMNTAQNMGRWKSLFCRSFVKRVNN